MTDYISREAFLEQYRSLYCSDCDGRKNSSGKIVYEIGDVPCRACDTGDMLDAIEDFPAADVVEVVHGEWVDMQPPDADGNVQCWCSVCGAGELHAENQVVPYCWKCGAKMRPTSMSGTNGGANNAAD